MLAIVQQVLKKISKKSQNESILKTMPNHICGWVNCLFQTQIQISKIVPIDYYSAMESADNEPVTPALLELTHNGQLEATVYLQEAK